MDQESIVYGYIKGASSLSESEIFEQITTNKKAILSLPTSEAWPFLIRDMFSMPKIHDHPNSGSSNVIHFGMSYEGIEYEWKQWMDKFEALLSRMYWHSAIVHLETELSGTHTFQWESRDTVYVPGSGSFNVRCEWNHELGLVSGSN